MNRSFRVLYLGGPRQSGKTTLLTHMMKKDGHRRYITLDEPSARRLAQDDPALFLKTYPPPVLIDEVQYAPELFPHIKIHVDTVKKNGQFWLTGSGQFPLMKNLQESLAGRVGIATLMPLSFAEMRRASKEKQPFLPGKKYGNVPPPMTLEELFGIIIRGAFPELKEKPAMEKERYYESYIQTYIDRDICALYGIEKLSAFHRFLELCAARTGQIINYSDMARDAGISVPTAKEWMNVLEETLQVWLLRPWHVSRSKRIIKAPKLYMADTGMAAHLAKWPTAETLMSGTSAGAFFETFVIMDIVKSFLFRGIRPPLYYFRDKEKHEVDLLIEGNAGAVYPIEIKIRATTKQSDISGIRYLRSIAKQIGHAGIICVADQLSALDRDTDIIPYPLIN